mgnify:CR=1 FL=1
MFKVRNLKDKERVDTEFWIEETGFNDIVLKARLNNQKQEHIIAWINENSMILHAGIGEHLGFRTIEKNGKSYINVC